MTRFERWLDAFVKIVVVACVLLLTYRVNEIEGRLAAIPVVPAPVPGPTPDPGPKPDPVSSTVKLGHDHGVSVAHSWADGLDAAGAAIDDKKVMADVLKDLATAFEASRVADFNTQIKPILTAILPNDAKIDPVSGAKLKTVLKDLATGARGVK